MFVRDGRLHVPMQTHQDVLDIAAALLRENLGSEEIKLNLQCHSRVDESRSEASINLTSSFLLMMSIGTAPYVIPGGTDLIRKDDSGPIKDCIAAHFNPGKRSEEAVKLDTLFTAQNLDRIAGLKITWTDDISDHLRLFKFDTEVAIVHHVSFLMMAKHA